MSSHLANVQASLIKAYAFIFAISNPWSTQSDAIDWSIDNVPTQNMCHVAEIYDFIA